MGRHRAAVMELGKCHKDLFVGGVAEALTHRMGGIVAKTFTCGLSRFDFQRALAMRLPQRTVKRMTMFKANGAPWRP